MSLLRSFDESDEVILHRLFFALKPTAEAVSEIAEERGRIGVAKSHVSDDRLHLTLWALDLAMTPTPGTITRPADSTTTGSAVRTLSRPRRSSARCTEVTLPAP